MIFNSFQFVWLFPVIFVMYWLVTGKGNKSKYYSQMSNAFLIVVSYALYIQWKPVYALVLLSVTAVTYIGARIIEAKNAYGKQKYLLAIALCLAALPLLVFKYYDFVSGQLNVLLGTLNVEGTLPGLNLALPLGISFFTLQAISYLYDVYKRKIPAEHNWWHYMLFVGFFPQIASGPISKASELLPQIKSQRHFDYSQAVQGLKLLFWGMFQKVVVADRLGACISSYDAEIATISGETNLILCIFYTFQIYADFAGYSNMAVGVGKLMGFELINNFKRPYFSASVTDFWHRWHISLSTWLRDYIYIPLGGSRCSKIKNYSNIIITFIVSGLWHGANWTFVVWGLLHGIFQVVEKLCGINKKQFWCISKFIHVFITFILVSFAWVFFRNDSLRDALSQIGYIFTNWSCSINIPNDSLVLIMTALIILIYKDFVDEFNIKSLKLFDNKYFLVRWGAYLMCLILILLMGVFDNSQFIYINF